MIIDYNRNTLIPKSLRNNIKLVLVAETLDFIDVFDTVGTYLDSNIVLYFAWDTEVWHRISTIIYSVIVFLFTHSQ